MTCRSGPSPSWPVACSARPRDAGVPTGRLTADETSGQGQAAAGVVRAARAALRAGSPASATRWPLPTPRQRRVRALIAELLESAWQVLGRRWRTWPAPLRLCPYRPAGRLRPELGALVTPPLSDPAPGRCGGREGRLGSICICAFITISSSRRSGTDQSLPGMISAVAADHRMRSDRWGE
jgi:hypothetical protein